MSANYQLFANLTNDEYDRLKADIAVNGVRDPIELDEEGNVLDGHHRKDIADHLGIPYPTVVRNGWTEEQKREHVIALHLGRRNLSPDDRKQFIRQLKAENPEMTQRQIAAKVGVTPMTVSRDITVTDVTRDKPPDDRPDRAREMAVTNPGMKQREIAVAVGASQSAVHNWLHEAEKEAKKAADPAPKWTDFDVAMTSIEAQSRADAAMIAAVVPPKRRQTTAKRLREEGMVLGRIAVCLEQFGRLGNS